MSNTTENKTTEYSFDGQPKQQKPFTMSDARAKYYYDLCATKGIKGINIYEVKSNDEFDAELSKVRSFRKPSDAQIKLIQQKIENLASMDIHVDIPELLTGGADGTAGLFIQTLIAIEKEHYEDAKPTDAQLKAIVGYYLCPDVAFEDYDISRRISLDLFPGAWRRPTPSEFAEIVKSKMNRRQASEFIDKYRGAFYEWSKTRIRPEQINYIRNLEERFKSNNSRVLDTAVTIGGQTFTYTSDKHESPINEYVALDDLELRMMSVEDASRFISMMKAELENKSLYTFGEKSDDSDTFEVIRNKTKTKTDAKDEELKDLIRIAYKLEAVAGYKLPELHNLIDEIVVEYDDCEQASKIRDEFLNLIDDGSITIAGMLELFGSNQTAINILLNR